MGRTRAWNYVIRVTTDEPNTAYSPMEWRVRGTKFCTGFGKPTAANVARWVERFEASRRPGGPNAHLGAARVTAARVTTNDSCGSTVAAWTRPAAAA